MIIKYREREKEGKKELLFSILRHLFLGCLIETTYFIRVRERKREKK